MNWKEGIDEEWRSIPGHERYQCSSLGNIRSLDMIVECKNGRSYKKKGRELKQQLCKATGYLKVKFYLNGATFNVHKLIAETFLGGSGECVNHKNGNRSENRVNNLELTSYSENNIHAYRVLKRKAPMAGVFGRFNANSLPVIGTCVNTGVEKFYESMGLAESDGFSHSKISNCIHGKRKTHGGMTWRLAE